MLCLRLCVLGLAGTAASLVPPMRGHGGQEGGRMASSRRDVLSAASASLMALAATPLPSHASYALYQASYDSYGERKATGYVPVATSDKATLSAIQNDIQRKRPQSALKAKKPPQYCAGQTSAVSPMLENVCANIGVSKADQSNAMVDSYGNMNVGAFNGLSGRDAYEADARQAYVRQAATAARQRSESARKKAN